MRKIEASDNKEVRHLIEAVMAEYNCVGEGYSINDPELKNMFDSYNHPKALFIVITHQNKILGCGGFAPLKGGDENICELRKMYFRNQLRGLGLGRKLLEFFISEAKKVGYSKMYLETVERMISANRLYLKNGFSPLCSNEGQTGHSSCDSYYMKEL